jgi:hypothetical protein
MYECRIFTEDQICFLLWICFMHYFTTICVNIISRRINLLKFYASNVSLVLFSLLYTVEFSQTSRALLRLS